MKAALAVLTCLLVGCAGPFVRVAAPPASAAQPGTLVNGTGCGVMVLGVLPVGMGGQTERAYREASAQAGGRGLTDTAITTSWYYAVVGTVHCVDVDGSAVP